MSDNNRLRTLVDLFDTLLWGMVDSCDRSDGCGRGNGLGRGDCCVDVVE